MVTKGLMDIKLHLNSCTTQTKIPSSKREPEKRTNYLTVNKNYTKNKLLKKKTSRKYVHYACFFTTT
jgi:hypothetical protein